MFGAFLFPNHFPWEIFADSKISAYFCSMMRNRYIFLNINLLLFLAYASVGWAQLSDMQRKNSSRHACAFIADKQLNTDGQQLRLNIANRFDHMNLKDNVTFNWVFSEDRDTIARGAFSPDCESHTTSQYLLTLPTKPSSTRINLLCVEISDARGNIILRQSLPVNPKPLSSRLLEKLPKTTEDVMAKVQDGMLIRAGHKAALATDSTYAVPIATSIRTEKVGPATHITFSLMPDTTGTSHSELGIAFLLAKRLDRVQWIGNGPKPLYYSLYAGRYGFWGLQQGDLYFDGKRSGVDAALFTDADGDGVLLFCDNGNVSFKQTDRGIVVTYNAAVSGDFYLYSVNGKQVPQLIHDLFDHPRTIAPPFRPNLKKNQ